MANRRFTAVAVASGLALAGLLAYGIATAPTDKERVTAAARAFVDAGNRMTPDEVRRSFGQPDQVFRNNPRALCWAYANPYEIRMCWGPKRQAAWISHNIPLRPVVAVTRTLEGGQA
jgi:hypothetical protein